MTTLKITTFLMCPASARAPLGGPPLERGDTGGHIRKDAEEWTHIGDLAVDLLAVLLVQRFLPLPVAGDDQQHADQRTEERERRGAEAPELEGHEGEVQADQDDGGTDDDLGEGEAHGSGPLFHRLGAGLHAQDIPSDIGAEVFAADGSAGCAFNFRAPLSGNSTLAALPLPYGSRSHAQPFCERRSRTKGGDCALDGCRCGGLFHAAILKRRFSFCQPTLVASGLTASDTRAMLKTKDAQTPDQIALAANFTRALAESGVSPKAIADARQITEQAVSNWKRTGKIKREHLPTIAALTGWTVAQLLSADGDGPGQAQSSVPAKGSSPAAEVQFSPGFEQLSIPVLANSGSMGVGNEQLHDEVVVGRLTVSPQWVSRTLKPTSLQNLRFIHGYGDSMEPTFVDGDVLLVDVGVQEPKIDGVYVLEANDRIYIKRVRQRMDGSFEISSDNPTVKTVDVLDGTAQVGVRGRVVWVWNGRKM